MPKGDSWPRSLENDLDRFYTFLSFFEQREFALRLPETKGASLCIRANERKGSRTCTKLSKKGVLFTTCLYGLKCTCQLKIR